jgi:hypothetical protein
MDSLEDFFFFLDMVEGVGITAFFGRRWTPGRRLRNNGALELLLVFKFLSKVSDSEREMTILYVVVARGTVVLAVFSVVTGNTGAVARRILEKLPAEADSKLCFSQDSNIVSLITAGAGSTFSNNYPDTCLSR